MVGVKPGNSSSDQPAVFDQNNKVRVVDLGILFYDPGFETMEEVLAVNLNAMGLSVAEDENIVVEAEFVVFAPV